MPDTLIHSFDEPSTNSFKMPVFVSIVAIVVVLGIFAGYLTGSKKQTGSASGGSTTTEKVAGIKDKKTFKDKAEGILQEGGIEGEGNFHLQRPGGVSQNVYLTSTTVDLSEYVGKKVRVWGETFSGEKAGWLMDVGLVELL